MEFANIDIKELAIFICETLKSNDIDAVLVGGACVSIYSQNRYQSYDLDFVTYEEIKSIEKVLSKLGFERIGRCFENPECPFIIDFVNPPIAIGNEFIQKFKSLQSSVGTLKLLTPTDCVKDRLSAFFHWNDKQGLEQALLVAVENKINIKDIVRWAEAEGHHKKLKIFQDELERLQSI